MVYSLTYQRPPYVRSSRSSFQTQESTKAESFSSGTSCPYGIPDALSFDKIISGGTCPVSQALGCPLFHPVDRSAPEAGIY